MNALAGKLDAGERERQELKARMKVFLEQATPAQLARLGREIDAIAREEGQAAVAKGQMRPILAQVRAMLQTRPNEYEPTQGVYGSDRMGKVVGNDDPAALRLSLMGWIRQSVKSFNGIVDRDMVRAALETVERHAYPLQSEIPYAVAIEALDRAMLRTPVPQQAPTMAELQRALAANGERLEVKQGTFWRSANGDVQENAPDMKLQRVFNEKGELGLVALADRHRFEQIDATAYRVVSVNGDGPKHPWRIYDLQTQALSSIMTAVQFRQKRSSADTEESRPNDCLIFLPPFM